MLPEAKTVENALAGFKTKPFGPIKYMEGPCHKSENYLKLSHIMTT